MRRRVSDKRVDRRRFSRTADRSSGKNSSEFRQKKVFRGGIRL